MEAMAARTRTDARRRYPDPETKFEFVAVPGRSDPTYDSLVTPAYYAFWSGIGVRQVRVDLPNCGYPAIRIDGKPSKVTTLQPGHPIARAYRRRSKSPRRKCTTSLSTCLIPMP